MDTLRSVEAEADYSQADEPRMDPPPAIGTDERRMHVRAYNYWVSLLQGRAYPSIEDLDPASIEDFGPHSVLLDFTAGPENPALAFLGRALREEGGHDQSVANITDVPSGSLLSRLTDHYLQIIANRAPIGFEAEFVNRRGHNTMYRGILMPFSSNDESIDFIYGVINWKEMIDEAKTAELVLEIGQALLDAPASRPGPVWADGPRAAAIEQPRHVLPEIDYGVPSLEGAEDDGAEVMRGPAWSEHPQTAARSSLILPEAEYEAPIFADDDFDAEAGLADRLAAAREVAEVARSSDIRSRAALYRAIACAYDFALAAEAEPADYAEMLADAGLKMQQRAPMTPVVKLIFGADYDKTRLTEFAAVLGHGRRIGLEMGAMQPFVDAFHGGIKGIVAAERDARRPAQSGADAANRARVALRIAAPRAIIDLGVDVAAGTDEFVLLVARREADGKVAVLAPVTGEAAMVERALRKVAG